MVKAVWSVFIVAAICGFAIPSVENVGAATRTPSSSATSTTESAGHLRPIPPPNYDLPPALAKVLVLPRRYDDVGVAICAQKRSADAHTCDFYHNLPGLVVANYYTQAARGAAIRSTLVDVLEREDWRFSSTQVGQNVVGMTGHNWQGTMNVYVAPRDKDDGIGKNREDVVVEIALSPL